VPNLTPKDQLTDFLLYTTPNNDIRVETYLHDETHYGYRKKQLQHSLGVQDLLLQNT